MLGKSTSIKAITTLFYCGIVSIVLQSILIGKIVSVNTTYDKPIEFISDGVLWHSSERADNVPLGVFVGIFSFVVLVIVWKVICDLLVIVFRAIELYIYKNQTIETDQQDNTIIDE